MKRIILSVLVLLVAATSVSAQISRRGKKLEVSRYDNGIMYGVVGGVSMPKFEYSDDNISDMTADIILRPNVGAFVEFPFGDFFSIAPELLLASKGFSTNYLYGKEMHSIAYKVKSRYASLRIPFMFRFSIAGKRNVQPFIFVAPDFSYLLGGKITMTQSGLPISDVSVNIGEANMNNYDYGLYFGIGLRSKFRFYNKMMLLRFDLGYNIGFNDTYSSMELDDTAIPENIHAYNVTGTRLNRAFEFNIHISIPSRIKQPGCGEINSIYNDAPASGKKYRNGRNLDKTFGK
ncbi:MAG: PorT family protein [bacterium]|nr:PorT family protein [Candidatus Limimorpha caballi]MCQ2317018.1 PorT family protein [Bacteroidales bacterium]